MNNPYSMFTSPSSMLMENGINGGDRGVNHNITCDDVISKLKDDGDFDKLRIKIIRKIKENEELRNSIVSIVKQSSAINRVGAENLKLRQLSDAVHQEVREKLNEQVSVVLWEVIRSPDGMKTEITETVRSVYDKLMNPKQVGFAESAGRDLKRACVGRELQEPRGFLQTVSHPNDVINPIPEQYKETGHGSLEVLENDSTRGANNEHGVGGNGSDEDLDAPPGFS